MSTSSARLGLPFLQPSQAQKHVTHNEALQRLDFITQLVVEEFDAADPPGLAEAGQVWALGAAPTGVWAGQGETLAAWDGTGWQFIEPQAGWRAWGQSEGNFLVWDGTDWAAPDHDFGALDGLGINTGYDAFNRLSVAADATLLTHDGAGHQVKVNKAAVGDTASLLFQTGYYGRAEMGTAGNDDFAIKVSSDGATWNTGATVDAATGEITFPSGVRDAVVGLKVPSYIPSPLANIWLSNVSRGATPRAYQVSSASGDSVSLVSGADAVFGTYMTGNVMVRIWNTTKSPAEPAWAVASSGQTITVLDAASIASWSTGDTVQLGDPNPTGENVRGMIALDISPYLQASFGSVFPQSGVQLYTYAGSSDGPAKIGFSPSGANGSVLHNFASNAGSPGTMAAPLPTHVRSPVSNSNLLFVEESPNGASDISSGLVRILGVFI